jgi:hypothetical protein
MTREEEISHSALMIMAFRGVPFSTALAMARQVADERDRPPAPVASLSPPEQEKP